MQIFGGFERAKRQKEDQSNSPAEDLFNRRPVVMSARLQAARL